MSEQATKTKEATPSKKVQEPHILAAVDDGYAQMKIAFGDPESDVPPTLDSVRSSASYGSLGSLSGGAVGAYETDGGKVTMTVSDEIRGEATNFDGFHTSPLNRILMAHTLISVGLGGKKVDLWAALPVKDFFLSQSALNKELIDKKKENLREPVISLVHGVECAEYGSINIGCQAVSAIIDYALTDDLTERNESMDRIAVVDIGGRTTDIAYVIGGNRLDNDRSGTQNIGVLEVQNKLDALICERFRLTSSQFAPKVLDDALRSGKIKVFGKHEDITDLIARATPEPSARLETMIRQKIGDGAELDAILFVGGGAKLFSAAAKGFRNAVIPQDPEFSNARGLYKYARMSR